MRVRVDETLWIVQFRLKLGVEKEMCEKYKLQEFFYQ